MTTVTKPIPEDLLAFKQVLLDDLVKILEQHQPVIVRRWLKPNEAMHVLGISRHKLSVLRQTGAIVFRKVGDNYSYDYESVMKFNLSDEEGAPAYAGDQLLRAKPTKQSVSMDRDPQLYAGREDEVPENQIQESR